MKTPAGIRTAALNGPIETKVGQWVTLEINVPWRLTGMNDELLNRRVLREISKAGRPISCYAIKDALFGHKKDRLSDVRGALEQLIEDGDVVAVGACYARAHGGYGSGPGDTAA